MIKKSIQQEDVSIINVNLPNYRVPGYLPQMLIDLKGDMDSNTIIMRKFNTPPPSMYRSTRQKINKNNRANLHCRPKDLTGIYRKFH